MEISVLLRSKEVKPRLLQTTLLCLWFSGPKVLLANCYGYGYLLNAVYSCASILLNKQFLGTASAKGCVQVCESEAVLASYACILVWEASTEQVILLGRSLGNVPGDGQMHKG